MVNIYMTSSFSLCEYFRSFIPDWMQVMLVAETGAGAGGAETRGAGVGRAKVMAEKAEKTGKGESRLRRELREQMPDTWQSSDSLNSDLDKLDENLRTITEMVTRSSVFLHRNIVISCFSYAHLIHMQPSRGCKRSLDARKQYKVC